MSEDKRMVLWSNGAYRILYGIDAPTCQSDSVCNDESIGEFEGRALCAKHLLRARKHKARPKPVIAVRVDGAGAAEDLGPEPV